MVSTQAGHLAAAKVSEGFVFVTLVRDYPPPLPPSSLGLSEIAFVFSFRIWIFFMLISDVYVVKFDDCLNLQVKGFIK